MNNPYIIKNILELEDSDIEIINNIFFESSAKSHFSNLKEREEFQFKYLDFYKIYYSNYFLVICDQEHKPLGYTCIVPEILKVKKMFELTPHLHAFKELFKTYPAHLHINMSAECRGMGHGGLLFEAAQKILVENNILGLHIITAPDARNRGFYHKNGFTDEQVCEYRGIELLFMGKQLNFQK